MQQTGLFEDVLMSAEESERKAVKGSLPAGIGGHGRQRVERGEAGRRQHGLRGGAAEPLRELHGLGWGQARESSVL